MSNISTNQYIGSYKIDLLGQNKKMLRPIKYFNTNNILHNFQDAASLTKQIGIKNAIEYNINDYLFTLGKNYFADKINKLQDKLIVGLLTGNIDDIKNICWYLKQLDPGLYKKYIDKSDEVLLSFVKNDEIYYKLPCGKFTFACRDKTKVIVIVSEGSFNDFIKIYFIGPHRNKHAEFLEKFCDKYRSRYMTVDTLEINKDGKMANEIDDDIDGISENSIIFPEKAEIFGYLDAWLESETYFTACGINHKIGILLYGEPGTGKTTFAKVLATKYDLALIKFNLKDISKLISKSCFWEKLENSVVVLEDIDVLVSKRDDSVTSEDKENFQALLQLLDGINSCKKTIFLATTNYIENLDSALIRDGRFDIKVEMKNFNKAEATEMCNKFNMDSEVVLRNEKFPINPAFLQNKIITLQMKEVNEKLKQKAQRIGSNKQRGDNK